VLNMQPCRGRKPALGSAAHCRSRLCVTQASPDMASRAGRRSPQKRRYRTKSVGELQCGSVNESFRTWLQAQSRCAVKGLGLRLRRAAAQSAAWPRSR
jgi:hypothetical protein